MKAIEAIHKIGRLVFTTREIAALTSSSMSNVSQSLKRLERQAVIKRIVQGVWAFVHDKRFTPYLVIPYLMPNHRAYLSFISALHNYGVISQIPQVITVASTGHTKMIDTPVGTFSVHQISPDFFEGFDWHGVDDYLIAEPEKALVDCLYLASRRGKRFRHFPEIDIDELNKISIRRWIDRINDDRIRRAAMNRLDDLGVK